MTRGQADAASRIENQRALAGGAPGIHACVKCVDVVRHDRLAKGRRGMPGHDVAEMKVDTGLCARNEAGVGVHRRFFQSGQIDCSTGTRVGTSLYASRECIAAALMSSHHDALVAAFVALPAHDGHCICLAVPIKRVQSVFTVPLQATADALRKGVD